MEIEKFTDLAYCRDNEEQDAWPEWEAQHEEEAGEERWDFTNGYWDEPETGAR